jgi:hypothetical protein
MITEVRAKQFQIIYEQETGEKLTLEESFKYSERLVEMIYLTYRPIKSSTLMKTPRRWYNLVTYPTKPSEILYCLTKWAVLPSVSDCWISVSKKYGKR